MDIKQNVINALRAAGKTQLDLCEALGVTKQSMQYYFRGNITLSKLGEIAAALGVQPWDLLRPGGVPDPRHPGEAVQDLSHPGEAVQDPRHPGEAVQDLSHPGEAVQTICPHCGKPLQILVK